VYSYLPHVKHGEIALGNLGFATFSLLASHHDPNLAVRGGRLTALAQ